MPVPSSPPDLELVVVHDDGHGMRFGGGHPTDARRHQLAVALCRACGLFDLPGVALEPGPDPLTPDELARVFAPAFIRAIMRYSAQPILAAGLEASNWGIGGDNNAYEGMHEDSARACSACARGADLVATGVTRRAFVPAGGAHHGLAYRAMGFGVYNETAVAVSRLLDHGFERVAYVDVDVHHGNGTQAIFDDDPRVMTISVHETGRFLFPGSGFAHEVGGPNAQGTAVNLALPPDSGDAEYRRAMDEVVGPAVRAFAPQAIVAQCGVDHHHADPLSHMLTTMALYPWMWLRLVGLADEVCDGRLVALGGGGYNPCVAPPRAWAALALQMAGRPLDGDAPLPDEWRARSAEVGCDEPARTWLEDEGPAPDPERDRRAAAGTDEAIAATRGQLERFWDLPGG